MSKNTKINLNFDKDKIIEKINFFTKRRYDFVIVLLSISFIYVSLNLSSALDIIKKKDQEINKIGSYATYITDSGVIKQYQREVFNVFNEKLNVANVLVEYLAQSAYKVTDGYKISTFNSSEQLFKKYKPFQDFYSNFISINLDNATEEEKQELKNVKLNWKQILRWFTNAVNNNSLPQTMEKKKDSINVSIWNTNKNKFSIIFSMPVYTSSRNKYNVIDQGISNITIEAKGYYNLMEKTTLNPYGMKFTYIKLIHPTIDNTKRK